MDWLKEILGDKYTDEIAKKVSSSLEKDYAPRSDLEAITAGKETAETQLKEANTTIEGLKGQDIDGVQKIADDWKLRFETLQKESEQKLSDFQFDSDFRAAVTQCKGRSAPAIRAELGEEKISELRKSSNRMEDLTKALETHRTEKDFLYDLSDIPPVPPSGTGTAKVNEPAGNGGLKESIASALFPKQ